MRSTLCLLSLLAACAETPAPAPASAPASASEAEAPAGRVIQGDSILTCAAMACPPEAHCELESRWYLDPTKAEGRHLDAIHVATCVMDEDEPTG